MPKLTDEDVARSAIRSAGKNYPHLLKISSRFGPRAKDIALRYIETAPTLPRDVEYVERIMFLIRSEFGKKSAKAKKKKKERNALAALREKKKKTEQEAEAKLRADRERQFALDLPHR